MSPPEGWKKRLFLTVDVCLFLWFIAGFIWLSILSVERGLQNTADEAQEKLKTITTWSIPWIGVLFVVGVPFFYLSSKHDYMPFWFSWLDQHEKKNP